MPANQLRGAIAPLIATRRHRLRVQPAPHIAGEGGDRRVARLGNLAQRFHDNRIERPAQPVAERIRRSLTGFADRDRRLRFGGAVGARHGLDAADRGARPLRLQLAHDARNFFRRAPVEPERAMAGQHFIHQQAERIDVGGGRNRPAANLLGAGVLRRHRARQRGHGRIAVGAGAQPLGDAEIEQLDLAVGCHQHVARFQIAVNDLAIVRMLDRVEHVEAQPHAIRDVQTAIVGVAIDRRAGDVLHHEVGKPLRRGAAIEEAGDVGMVQRREHLPLVAEATHDEVGIHAAADHLDRDRMREVAGMAREVDGAHSAAAEAAVDHVCADRAAEVRIVALVLIAGVDCRGRDEQTRVGIGGEQRLDFRAQFRVAGAVRLENGGAFIRRRIEGERQDLFDPGPGGHDRRGSYPSAASAGHILQSQGCAGFGLFPA